MKTYLKLLISSEGAPPSEVKNVLLNLGFQAVKGSYDFVYQWGDDASVDDILWFADRIHAALKGMHVQFEMETI